MSFYNIAVKTINGQPFNLAQLKGKVVLIVNVASKCGFTKHYAGLQRLYAENKDKGLVILGFPCNQFGSQEPGTPAEIQQFCSATYGVEFPLLEKGDVNGDNTHALYQYLKTQKEGEIKWNFEKFLVDRNGNVVERFLYKKSPEEIEKEILSKL